MMMMISMKKITMMMWILVMKGIVMIGSDKHEVLVVNLILHINVGFKRDQNL